MLSLCGQILLTQEVSQFICVDTTTPMSSEFESRIAFVHFVCWFSFWSTDGHPTFQPPPNRWPFVVAQWPDPRRQIWLVLQNRQMCGCSGMPAPGCGRPIRDDGCSSSIAYVVRDIGLSAFVIGSLLCFSSLPWSLSGFKCFAACLDSQRLNLTASQVQTNYKWFVNNFVNDCVVQFGCLFQPAHCYFFMCGARIYTYINIYTHIQFFWLFTLIYAYIESQCILAHSNDLSKPHLSSFRQLFKIRQAAFAYPTLLALVPPKQKSSHAVPQHRADHDLHFHVDLFPESGWWHKFLLPGYNM